MEFSFKNVFDKYTKTATDNLTEKIYNLYKKIRLKFENIFPLSDHDKFLFSEHESLLHGSSDIPMGYDYIKKKEVNGYINFEYIDFIDYIPKEELEVFKNEVKKYYGKSRSFFSTISRDSDFNQRIDNIRRLSSYSAFCHLFSVPVSKKCKIRGFANHLTVSLYNLSPTFAIVKYRYNITKDFNEKFNKILNTSYKEKSTPFKTVGIPWYKIKHFGINTTLGDAVKRQEVYLLISHLKWEILKDIMANFTTFFTKDRIFPPVFEMYSTNIRPNKDRKADFWEGVLSGEEIDYSAKYNTCVCFDYDEGKSEGTRISAYWGGPYTEDNFLPEYFMRNLSDDYIAYMATVTFNKILEKDVIEYNKKASKAIRKSTVNRLLRTRVEAEHKLYYGYRFACEFKGEPIKKDSVSYFKCPYFKNKSFSTIRFDAALESTKRNKEQVDRLFNLLNSATEYKNSKSNFVLQWIMAIITILSLITAVITLIKSSDTTQLQSVLNLLLL